MAMPDQVLFGVDRPPEANKIAVEFLESAPVLNDSDKEKTYHLNAEKIFMRLISGKQRTSAGK